MSHCLKERTLDATRLDAAEEEIAARIAQVLEDQDALKAKTDALHSEIENLKQTIPNLKKPGFMGRVMVRLSTFLEDEGTRDLLKSGAVELGKKLLTGGG